MRAIYVILQTISFRLIAFHSVCMSVNHIVWSFHHLFISEILQFEKVLRHLCRRRFLREKEGGEEDTNGG